MSVIAAVALALADPSCSRSSAARDSEPPPGRSGRTHGAGGRE